MTARTNPVLTRGASQGPAGNQVITRTIQAITRMRPVTVSQIPEQVNTAEERRFLRNLDKIIEAERPRLVLDCSKVSQMNAATIHLLLCSLEEVMKRNGDAKLASLPPGAEAMLQMAGVDRLFEMLPTTAEAVSSFEQGPVTMVPPELLAEGFDSEAETAA